MTALYIFAAAAGVPLLAWFLFGGGDDGAESAGGDESIGGIVARLLPLSTVAIAMATFGICGLALRLLDAGATVTFLCAAGTGAVAGVLNGTVFAYLRRSESTADVADGGLAGSIGRVVLPITDGHRGKVAISAAGQQIQLSARLAPTAAGADAGELETGAPVLVVEVRNGIALVARLDPELT